MSCLGWGPVPKRGDLRGNSRLGPCAGGEPSPGLISSLFHQRARLWLSGTALALVASSPAFATDFMVNSDATLRAALTNAVAGDSITFTASISTVSDLPA